MTEGNVFTLSTISGGGGWYPISSLDGGGGYTISGVDRGGTPFQVQVVWYPIPGLDRGVLHPADGGGEGYPIPGLDGGYRILLMGGYPHQRLDEVPPPQSKSKWGNSRLSRTGWGPIPWVKEWLGYPPLIEDWMGYPPPISQSSIASTCFAADGMPLAFTQEDFLVWDESTFTKRLPVNSVLCQGYALE